MHLKTEHTRSGLKRMIAISSMIGLLFLLTTAFTCPTSAATHSGSATRSTLVISPVTSDTQKTVQPNGTIHGCPVGWACIYPENAGWNGDHPSLMYYYYGVYQLSNQFGDHYLYNNQTGGAWFYLCSDWNGNSCPIYVPNGGPGYHANLTPINSVKLNA